MRFAQLKPKIDDRSFVSPVRVSFIHLVTFLPDAKYFHAYLEKSFFWKYLKKHAILDFVMANEIFDLFLFLTKIV